MHQGSAAGSTPSVSAPGHIEEGSREQTGYMTQVELLMAQLSGAPQMLRIESPLLVAANTVVIVQCSRPI